MAVHIVADNWWVEIGEHKTSLGHGASYVSYPAELSWAPDGKAFYITGSNGSIAGFHTDVFGVDSSKVEHLADINRVIQRDFDGHHKCVFYDKGKKYQEDANIAGLGWMNNSKELLVIAEVRPDSSCHSEYFGGYLLLIPSGQILRRYTPQELTQQFGKLMGQRLQGDFADLTKKERSDAP